MQLVGQTCVLCQQRIPSVIDGRFCSRCHNPVHLECRERAVRELAADSCSRCGAPARVVEATAKARAEQASEAEGREGLQTVALGFMVPFGGLMFSMSCTGLAAGAGTGRIVIASGAIFGGIAIIIAGVTRSARR